MKTIRYDPNEWDAIWDRLAKDHSALSMGKALGFSIRKETEVWAFDDAPGGYDRVTVVYIDFKRDEDHTLFLLKYR
jgi:hypothetical protein